MSKYQFKRMYRNYNAGDPVPETFTPGVVDALLQRGVICACVEVAETVPSAAKTIDYPPADKSMANRSGKTRRKGAA